VIEMYKAQAKNVAPSPEQVDADVAKYHATMDAKDERDDMVKEIRSLVEELKRPKIWFKTMLRDRELSESLADAHVSWSTVDVAVIQEMRTALRKEAGR
jgi:cytidylate kinase